MSQDQAVSDLFSGTDKMYNQLVEREGRDSSLGIFHDIQNMGMFED